MKWAAGTRLGQAWLHEGSPRGG